MKNDVAGWICSWCGPEPRDPLGLGFGLGQQRDVMQRCWFPAAALIVVQPAPSTATESTEEVH